MPRRSSANTAASWSTTRHGRKRRRKPRQPRNRRPAPWRPACAIMLLLFMGTCIYLANTTTTGSSGGSRPTVTTPAPAPAPAGPVLELVDWNWKQASAADFVEAQGQVTNISSGSLRNVTAVVTFLTASGDFITSTDALIDFNPILPGQTSPWSVITTWNPAMQSARVEFKDLLGPKLNHRVK